MNNIALDRAGAPVRRRISANTFRAIDINPQAAAEQPFREFVETLLENLEQVKNERSAFHQNLLRSYTKWANGARALLAFLGSIAFLLTGLAAAIRFAPEFSLFNSVPGGDKGVMIIILAIYAIMGAITFYEKGTDKTTAYFRQVATILALRDLWTKAQFEFLKELIALKNAADPTVAEPAARERIRTLAEAFCNDLNKASTGELTDFRTEFLTSLSELDTASKKGTDDATKQLQDLVAAAGKAAADAKAAAEKAASEARTAAKTMEDAAKPGFLNLTVVGDFDDEIAISVDSAEPVRSRGKIVAIERVPPGPRKISARAKKGTKELETSLVVDVKPGLQDVRLTIG